MNHAVPEPTQEAVAENDAEERSRQPVRFTDKTFDIIKHGQMVVEAVHVGEPSLEDPKRTLAPDITKQNIAMFADALNAGKPPAPAVGGVTPTGPNEPTRSDAPSTVPLQLAPPSGGGTGVGAEIVSAPAGAAAPDPNAGLKPVGPVNSALPAAEKPAEAPMPVNEVKSSGATATDLKVKDKKPKVDSKEESDSKKKKKKGLAKLNPF
jgi:outer membrane protein assembly factor BamD